MIERGKIEGKIICRGLLPSIENIIGLESKNKYLGFRIEGLNDRTKVRFSRSQSRFVAREYLEWI